MSGKHHRRTVQSYLGKLYHKAQKGTLTEAILRKREDGLRFFSGMFEEDCENELKAIRLYREQTKKKQDKRVAEHLAK